jgi:hypothetical protein
MPPRTQHAKHPLQLCDWIGEVLKRVVKHDGSQVTSVLQISKHLRGTAFAGETRELSVRLHTHQFPIIPSSTQSDEERTFATPVVE